MPPDQASVFRWLRYRQLRNNLKVSMETGKARLFTLIGVSAFVALLVFFFARYGFLELFSFKVPAKGLIVGGLFDLMFFTLGVMLIFSTGIILYASLFTSPEARFLLSTPAKADQIFATKFLGAVGFSSWAFLILGLPILIAYGTSTGVPWYFYPLLPVYLLGFVLLPGSVSALLCLLLVRYLPQNRKQALIIMGLVLTVIVGYWLVRIGLAAKQTLITQKKNEVESLIGQFQLVQSQWNPSHWMTNGLMAAARNEPDQALQPLAMLWSNGLMAYLLATWTSSQIYRSGFDRIAGSGSRKKVYRGNILDRIMEWLVWYLDKPTRILVVKDFRTFRRDPTQWVLLFIFGGLLLLSASNFKQYYRNDLAVLDKYVVSLVNVAATSVLLCAGLSRFIYPLISLEGRKFWVLGLMPIRREQILFGKFVFAATGSVLIAEVLILISDILLGMPLDSLAIHLLTVAVVGVGLSAINVGLGAYMPNFRETDPSKIVVGFGGTVNMVLGLMYLLIVISVMVLPVHLAGLRAGFEKTAEGISLWAYLGVPIGLVIGAIAVVVPLRAGSRALRETEF